MGMTPVDKGCSCAICNEHSCALPKEMEQPTRKEYLQCSQRHNICLNRGRRLMGYSDASPTFMKYDCPKCPTGAVLAVHHVMALIKGTYYWRLPNGQEGTRT